MQKYLSPLSSRREGAIEEFFHRIWDVFAAEGAFDDPGGGHYECGRVCPVQPAVGRGHFYRLGEETRTVMVAVVEADDNVRGVLGQCEVRPPEAV